MVGLGCKFGLSDFLVWVFSFIGVFFYFRLRLYVECSYVDLGFNGIGVLRLDGLKNCSVVVRNKIRLFENICLKL